MKFTKLRATKQKGSRLNVDRETGHGVIRGASLATEGEALGHGFKLDRRAIRQIAEKFPGKRGRWTHGGLSDDGLGRHLGAWENTSTREVEILDPDTGEARKALQAFGDFAFSESAHKIKPDGLDVPAPVYLMDRAEEDPSSFGVSIVAGFTFEPELDENGDQTGERLGRIASAKRADFVADPAANPVGLHSGLGGWNELHELAESEVPRLIKRLGMPEVRRRAVALLDRFEDQLAEQEPEPAPETQPQADEAEDTMELKEALAALEKKDAELAVLTKSLGEKDKLIASLNAREDDRVKERHEAYLQSLRDQASAAKVGPFKAADLEDVAKALSVNEDLGRKLGDSMLAALMATAEPTTTEDLAESDDDDSQAIAGLITAGGNLSDLKKKG